MSALRSMMAIQIPSQSTTVNDAVSRIEGRSLMAPTALPLKREIK